MRTLTHFIISLVATLVVGQSVHAQEVEKLQPKPDTISTQPASPSITPPKIIFPTIPVLDEKDIPEEDLPTPPVPKPKPGPKFVSKLDQDMLLVIESESPLMVFDFPEGLVSIEADDGARPMKIKAKFADGTGKMESRTFKSKYLYFIEALKSGEAELLIIPEGALSKSQSERHKITVMGQSPNPPPGPGPTPDPPPTPDPVVKSFRVIFVKESADTLNAEQSAIPGAKAIREYLNAKTTGEAGGVGWREYDPQEITTNETPIMKKLWEETVKPSITYLPCMVIEVNGHAVVKPFPKNVAEAMAILKKAGGE